MLLTYIISTPYIKLELIIVADNKIKIYNERFTNNNNNNNA